MTEALQQHREDLEFLAQSDLHVDWIARALLDIDEERAAK